jgi:glucokinase
MRLVADIGGTHARFGLLEPGAARPSRERVLACADFPGPAAAIRSYLVLEGEPVVREAALAVAGPVTQDRVDFMNRAWSFSIETTRVSLGLDRLVVVNDFTALALALPVLEPDERRQVGGGAPVPDMPIALLGAGTGLGVSGLLPSPTGWIPIAGEGGHTAFSPANAREAAVLVRLWERFDHVSTERLVQGAGFVLLYETLCALDGATPRELRPEDVTRDALAGTDAHCVETLDMFCGILGSAAANLAVTLGARGGVYVGGGIVPALGAAFDRSSFRARFEAKGRYRDYVSAMPTYVITATHPGLRGVARVFSRTRAR